MRNRRSHLLIAFAVVLSVGSMTASLAQNTIASKKMPLSALRHMKTHLASSDALAKFGTTKRAGLSTTAATTGTPGVDSLANWSDSFTAPGFDSNGNPQSVWPYTMVGAPPESGQTTVIKAPIVPVVVDLLGPDGTVAIFNGQPLTFAAGPDVVQNVVNSPIFQPFIYTNGVGQYNDQMMRAEFADRIPKTSDPEEGWHILLDPRVKTARRIQVPFNFWLFFVDNNNNPVLFALDANTFVNLFFPAFPVTNGTPIGAAELAGDITTKNMSTFLFNNIVLYDGDISQCCIIGFHTYDFEPGDKKNGNRERRYVLNFSSWLSPGLFLFGFEDITPLSHELNETFNDPFVNNATPWWLSVDPFTGGGNCQNNLETGDVVEVLDSLSPTYSIAMNSRTYHPQNEALFNWFAFQSPSRAHLGAYSFPDETTLTSLSPGSLLPGCVPAP